MSSFAPSTRYASWVTQLKLPFMSLLGQRRWGGLAAVLGDRAVDWATQALLEHLPAFASAPSIALIASERQMDTAPSEASSAIAARAPYQTRIARFAGSPWGVLLGLHFAGFDNAIVVQQNGMAYSLTLPLPAFSETWDPTTSFVTTPTAALDVALTPVAPATHIIPSGTPWWAIDLNTDFCSRFQVLFPGPAFPSSFTTWATATFTGAEDSVAVTWNNAFTDTTYKIEPGPATVTDGGGAINVAVDGTTISKTGCTVITTARFAGSVDLVAYQAGANPFADPHPADLTRLKSVIAKWMPRKATCLGVYVAAQGKFSAWPVSTMANMLGVPSTIVNVTGAF